MTALYIISGIIALVLILLMLRIKITVSYKKDTDGVGNSAVYLGIGPVKIKLYPKKEEKLKLSDYSAKKFRRLMEEEKAAAPADNSADTDKKAKKELLPGGIGETFELVLELVEKFRGRLRCEVLRLTINVGTGNAATTALAYSAVSSSVSFILEAIDSYTVMHLRSPKDVLVNADFEKNGYSCDLAFKFSIRTASMLSAGWGFIKNYLRTLISLDNQNK